MAQSWNCCRKPTRDERDFVPLVRIHTVDIRRLVDVYDILIAQIREAAACFDFEASCISVGACAGILHCDRRLRATTKATVAADRHWRSCGPGTAPTHASMSAAIPCPCDAPHRRRFRRTRNPASRDTKSAFAGHESFRCHASWPIVALPRPVPHRSRAEARPARCGSPHLGVSALGVRRPAAPCRRRRHPA